MTSETRVSTAILLPRFPAVAAAKSCSRINARPADVYRRLCQKSSGDAVTNPERIGDNRESGIHSSDRRKKARICNVQIINPMRLAAKIEDGLFGIGSKS